MASFKLPCPSCEHQVPVTEKAIGTKVECPKCKYRFKAEEPAGGIPKDADAKGDKGEKGDKKKKKADKAEKGDKKKSKKKLAVVVGVLAVVVLAGVGFAVMGGGDSKPKGGGGKGGMMPPPQNNLANSKGTDDTEVTPKKTPEVVDLGPKPKPTAAPSDKEASNLLPGQTAALYRFDLDKIKLTPLSFFFDSNGLKMFSGSFGVDVDQVAVYYHAFVGDTREPFGVMKLKAPVFQDEVVRNMAPVVGPAKIVKKKWQLYAFKSNPFANAVSNAFHFDSLFADLYEKLPTGPVRAATGPRVIGICWYDSQHLLVGDYGQLDVFLSSLDEKGLPKFQSAVNPKGANVIQAENPMYLSIDPKLKRVMKDLGSELPDPPLLVYGEKTVQGLYDPKLFKTDLQLLGSLLDPILTRMQYLGANVSSLNTYGMTATVRAVMDSDNSAFEVVRDQLVPTLPVAAEFTGLFLNTFVEGRNMTSVGTPTTVPGTDQPGAVGPQPMGVRPPPIGKDSESMPIPGMQPPIGPGVQPKDPNQPVMTVSHITLAMTDKNVTISTELNWSAEVYRTKIEPRLVGLVNTLKGKMAVFASDLSYYGLIAAVPKMTTPPNGRFPRGTADRKRGDASRMGLAYPPESRVSFFAEMLPFLGRDGLYRTINKDAAWYADDPKANLHNLEAGEAWVPELLVPTYPQSAWRATSKYVADGRILGATNYVGIAGSGVGAARYDPKNSELAKKVGITGYDWGSTVEDIKDGLSNTIYLMQTPPGGPPQPWIAGGGATVRGLNEAAPMYGLSHTYGTPNGKSGTYALMGDGSVRFIPANIDPKVVLAMSTRAGGDGDVLKDIDKAAPPIEIQKKAEAELKTEPKLEPKPEPKADPKKDAPKTETKKTSDSPVEPKKDPKATDTKADPKPADPKKDAPKTSDSPVEPKKELAPPPTEKK